FEIGLQAIGPRSGRVHALGRAQLCFADPAVDVPENARTSRPGRFGRPTGRAVFAFEATGHFWEAVAHYFTEHGHRYLLVNPLATFRVREARQMGRDKRDTRMRSRSRISSAPAW